MKSKRKAYRKATLKRLVAVDLFCGVGGLTTGLQSAGIKVVLGIDSDPACGYSYAHNSGAAFLESDVRLISGADLAKWYPTGSIRVLAGCAPCKPFSALRGGSEPKTAEWNLVKEFSRIAGELKPELITMENVPRAANKPVFQEFVSELKRLGYQVKYGSMYCPRFGVPQARRRLVLTASRLGPVELPTATVKKEDFSSVRMAIEGLPSLKAGEIDASDPIHRARSLSALNLRRFKASTPGGSWRQWPIELRSACHRKASGRSYGSVYARMAWDQPAPTITTQFYNFGTGRFGHPEQDRAITPREAALIQTFPRSFVFTAPGEQVKLGKLGRLIGNAVPPKLAEHIGAALIRSARVEY